MNGERAGTRTQDLQIKRKLFQENFGLFSTIEAAKPKSHNAQNPVDAGRGLATTSAPAGASISDAPAAIKTAERFGPWSDKIDAAKRLARLRSLRALARIYLGPRGIAFTEPLRRAETDPSALVEALTELERLASRDRRNVLASFAALHRTIA